jgi:serum/glucocorticoid-regulated kinase 2
MQIALALGHLHKSDVLYRDLKLENVLMDDDGNVCLTDFGMAKIVKEGQLATTFCGTPEYVAPEVISGGGYDKAADWWSLGILTY